MAFLLLMILVSCPALSKKASSTFQYALDFDVHIAHHLCLPSIILYTSYKSRLWSYLFLLLFHLTPVPRIQGLCVCVCVCALLTQSCLTLCDPWIVPCQAPPSMGFSSQEYWSALPFSSPGDLPNPGTGPGSPALQADSLPSEPPGNKGRNRRKSPWMHFLTNVRGRIS